MMMIFSGLTRIYQVRYISCMRFANAPTATVPHLAAWMEDDIRRRGLSCGDRYFTAEEAGQRLGVSTMTAHRAMKVLADRGLLNRRRRKGTFIGRAFSQREAVPLKCIHVLVPRDYQRVERALGEGFWAGLHSELPGISIQYDFVPDHEPMAFLRQVVEQATQGDSLEGLILALSTREMRQYVNELDLPIVVNGSVEPDLGNVSWVDRDQRQVGQILADYLLKRGHRRFALLMRNHWALGEDLMLEGVANSLAAAGLGLGALTIRSFPADEAMVSHSVGQLLSGLEGPTGFICRSEFLANSAARAVESMGFRVPQDVQVTLCDYFKPWPTRLRFPYAAPTLDARAVGAVAGRMLLQLAEGKPPDPHHVVVPVNVYDPEEGVSSGYLPPEGGTGDGFG